MLKFLFESDPILHKITFTYRIGPWELESVILFKNEVFDDLKAQKNTRLKYRIDVEITGSEVFLRRHTASSCYTFPKWDRTQYFPCCELDVVFSRSRWTDGPQMAMKLQKIIGREAWSSGYVRRLIFQRLWVLIPSPHTGWTFSHRLFVWKRGRDAHF